MKPGIDWNVSCAVGWLGIGLPYSGRCGSLVVHTSLFHGISCSAIFTSSCSLKLVTRNVCCHGSKGSHQSCVFPDMELLKHEQHIKPYTWWTLKPYSLNWPHPCLCRPSCDHWKFGAAAGETISATHPDIELDISWSMAEQGREGLGGLTNQKSFLLHRFDNEGKKPSIDS